MRLSLQELTVTASRDKLVAEIVRLRRSFSDCERCPAFIEKTVFDLMERARLSAEAFGNDARVRNKALEDVDSLVTILIDYRNGITGRAALLEARAKIRALKSKDPSNG